MLTHMPSTLRHFFFRWRRRHLFLCFDMMGSTECDAAQRTRSSDEMREQVKVLYKLMGSPDKTKDKMKKGKFGATTFEEVYVPTKDILQKMINFYQEDEGR
eukprot:COSAG01_NODE_3575_length_5917_cov_239.201100_1_plen_101_part_00